MSEYSNINNATPNVPVQSPVGGKVQKTSRAKSQAPKPPVQETDKETNKQHLLFASLPQLKAPHLDQAILADILKKLEVSVFNSQLAGSSAVIKSDHLKIESLLKENMKAITSMLARVVKQKSAGIAAKIFGWIGAALGVVIGGVLAVVSFGTGSVIAGLLITASLALAVTVTVLTATGAMGKLTTALAKPIAQMLESSGMSKKKAQQVAKIISQVTVAVVIIAVQIVLAVGTGFSNTGELVNETVQKVANIAVKATSFVMAANALAESGSNVAKGVFHYQSLQDQAKVADNKAFLQKMHTLIASEEETIKDIINALLGTQKKMGAIVHDENQARDQLSTLGGARSAV